MQVNFEKNIVVTGHYGSGKTNLSLNLAMDLRKRGKPVVLADLDIVNPYFRTADFRAFAADNGIQLVASDYAGSSLDIPALTASLDPKIGGGDSLIIDVGGDDAGAYALGRYAPRLEETGYTMLYVINAYRYLMKDPAECLSLLRDIEAASRLGATHIANCSNLGPGTTAEEIRVSLEYADKVAALTGLPIALTAVHSGIAADLGELGEREDLFPVEVYVTAPWNQ